MIRILPLVIIFLFHFKAFSQKRFFSEKSDITFFSKGVIEEIRANNTKVTSILDLLTGEVAYLLSPKDFQFEKKLMQVHFNEKYMESEKFPRSTFKGKIEGLDVSRTDVQKVKAVGKLTIHGVTRDVDIPGTIHIQGTTVTVQAKFMVKLLDYDIHVPQVVWQNIAQEVEVSVHFAYRPVTN